MEQWRIWEDENHVAFLTPFANTPGLTVLVPRRHSHSDVFRLDDTSYNSLLHASFSVMGILKQALGVPAVGLFFEGFEVDYTHAKLIPIHASSSQSTGSTSVQPAPFYEKYPGYITTQPGPVGELDSEAHRALVVKIQRAFWNMSSPNTVHPTTVIFAGHPGKTLLDLVCPDSVARKVFSSFQVVEGEEEKGN
jgi:diadenosine tetraphosphate (Ap4A) HIT family hydrolase